MLLLSQHNNNNIRLSKELNWPPLLSKPSSF